MIHQAAVGRVTEHLRALKPISIVRPKTFRTIVSELRASRYIKSESQTVDYRTGNLKQLLCKLFGEVWVRILTVNSKLSLQNGERPYESVNVNLPLDQHPPIY